MGKQSSNGNVWNYNHPARQRYLNKVSNNLLGFSENLWWDGTINNYFLNQIFIIIMLKFDKEEQECVYIEDLDF